MYSMAPTVKTTSWLTDNKTLVTVNFTGETAFFVGSTRQVTTSNQLSRPRTSSFHQFSSFSIDNIIVQRYHFFELALVVGLKGIFSATVISEPYLCHGDGLQEYDQHHLCNLTSCLMNNDSPLIVMSPDLTLRSQ